MVSRMRVFRGTAPGALRGQGATEYLVLLAVVLIIALVSIALLGFFPGMSEDAKLAQSQAYWKSAYPIAITEWGAKANNGQLTMPYFRLVNQGGNSIRITQVISGNENISMCVSYAQANISDMLGIISPGEAVVFGSAIYHPGISHATNCTIFIRSGDPQGGTLEEYTLFGASSTCGNASQGSGTYGTLVVNDFGFEYVAIVDGQEITNRQIGKTLMIKCLPCHGC